MPLDKIRELINKKNLTSEDLTQLRDLMNSTDQNAKNEALKQALFPKEIEDNLYGNNSPEPDLKIIRLLLLWGAKLSQEEFAYIKDEKLLAVLKEEESLLFSAIKDGDQEFVKLFLQLEVENLKDKLNASDSQGNTALHLAVRFNAKDITYLLLQRIEINPNIKNSQGKTALHLAVEIGDSRAVDIAKLLLKNTEINPNTQDSQGNTALHLAVEIGDSRNAVDIACLLLQRTEINPNTQDSQGNTALHLAVKSNNMAIADLLLNEGRADPNIPDSQGNTALYYAVKNGNADITELFLEACDTQRITILRNALSNFEQQEDLYSPTHLEKQNILQLLLQYGVQYADPQLVKLSIEFKVNLADFYQAKNSEEDFIFCEIIDNEDPQRLEMLKTLIEANFDLWEANREKLVRYIKKREEDDDSRETENIVNELQNKNKEESLQYLNGLIEKETPPQTKPGSPSSKQGTQASSK